MSFLEEEESGKLLFSRYVFPCAEDKLNAKKMSAEDVAWLEKIVKKICDPNGWLLDCCFRKAMNDYRRSCANRGVKADFSLASVTEFWRHHHGHIGDCAVKQGKVISVNTQFIEIEEITETTNKTQNCAVCINFYNLELFPGDNVFFHRRMVIEKIESATLR